MTRYSLKIWLAYKVRLWADAICSSHVKALVRADRRRKSRPLIVSDHAIIRYLERIKGIDLQAVSLALQEENLKRRYEKLGDGCYPVNDLMVVVKSGCISTVYPNNRRRLWQKAK